MICLTLLRGLRPGGDGGVYSQFTLLKRTALVAGALTAIVPTAGLDRSTSEESRECVCVCVRERERERESERARERARARERERERCEMFEWPPRMDWHQAFKRALAQGDYGRAVVALCGSCASHQKRETREPVRDLARGSARLLARLRPREG